MADIDQIIAGGAGATSRADFSGLADIPEAFWKGRDRRFTQEGRDLFKGGVPTNPDGSINYGAMRDALFQHGDIPQGTALDNLDIARQQLRFGQEQSGRIQGFEQGGAPPQQQPPIVSPPSSNRSAATPVAPPLNRGGVQQPQNGAPAPAGGTTIMQILDAQGIPNDQLGAASASIGRQLGVDPTQPIDINDPRVRNVLVPAVQQLRRAGVGNIIPDGQPSPPDQVLPQVRGPGGVVQPNAQGVYPSNAVMLPGGPQPPIMAQGAPPQPQPAPQPIPQAPPQGQPGPVTNAVTGTTAPAVPSRTDQAIAFYAGIMSNPLSPKNNVDYAKARLESYLKSTELTNEQKNYVQKKLEGFPGTMQELAVKEAADKTYAEKNTESYIKKYDAIQETGARARVELPQMALAKTLMSDPNYMSGVGEKYNLIYKRLLAQFGGDPDSAVPQEAFRKIISASILDQIKAMAGTGPVRVAEMNIIKDASASQDNSPQSNRLLVEIQSRLQKRAADIADMAQNYNNGRLDAGFDRKVAAYDRANPLISDKEIPDFRKIIGGKSQTAEAAPPVPNAKKAPDGNWYTPDPQRPGKYLKVVQ